MSNRKGQGDGTVSDNDATRAGEDQSASTLRLIARRERSSVPEPADDTGPPTLDDWLGDAHNDSDVARVPAEPEPRSRRRRPATKIKGNRGVDTLLRNAYRAQLDMIALAATKANIMISLNGLLMSMLVLSGTHFLSIDILYVIPISVFLLGCATATVFAVLAARPDVSKKTFGFTDFERDDARLLVFEEFSDLNEDEYIEAMTHMLSSPKRVYRCMVAHVHELGCTADRKYRMLYYSYTVFMVGFVLAAMSLVIVQAFKWTGTSI